MISYFASAFATVNALLHCYVRFPRLDFAGLGEPTRLGPFCSGGVIAGLIETNTYAIYITHQK